MDKKFPHHLNQFAVNIIKTYLLIYQKISNIKYKVPVPSLLHFHTEKTFNLRNLACIARM